MIAFNRITIGDKKIPDRRDLRDSTAPNSRKSGPAFAAILFLVDVIVPDRPLPGDQALWILQCDGPSLTKTG